MKMPDRMRLGPADAEDTWAESYETPEAPPYKLIAESIVIDPIHLLRNAEEDNEVHIYLKCPGGDASVRHLLLRIWP